MRAALLLALLLLAPVAGAGPVSLPLGAPDPTLHVCLAGPGFVCALEGGCVLIILGLELVCTLLPA